MTACRRKRGSTRLWQAISPAGGRQSYLLPCRTYRCILIETSSLLSLVIVFVASVVSRAEWDCSRGSGSRRLLRPVAYLSPSKDAYRPPLELPTALETTDRRGGSRPPWEIPTALGATIPGVGGFSESCGTLRELLTAWVGTDRSEVYRPLWDRSGRVTNCSAWGVAEFSRNFLSL